MDKQVVVSIKTILFGFAMLLGAFVVYRLSSIIGLFLIALLIVFAMESLIKYLMKGTFLNRKVSRSFAVVIAYALVAAVFIAVLTMWLPPFLVEGQKLIKNLPNIVNNIRFGDTKIDIPVAEFLSPTGAFSTGVLAATVSIFSNITALFSIFIMSLYMSADWMNLKKRFASLFPEKMEDLVHDTIEEVENNLGHWVKGEALLMFVVGFASFIGLALLNVEYALALGLISGILEVVPMIGPLISAVLAAVIAFADAPIKGVGVIALFIVIQQLENNILVPKVMQKVSGFSPLVILLALLIGSEFFGFVGAMTAVPVTMALAIITKRSLKYLR